MIIWKSKKIKFSQKLNFDKYDQNLFKFWLASDYLKFSKTKISWNWNFLINTMKIHLKFDYQTTIAIFWIVNFLKIEFSDKYNPNQFNSWLSNDYLKIMKFKISSNFKCLINMIEIHLKNDHLWLFEKHEIQSSQ